MPVLSSYSLPAFIQDFPPGSAEDSRLKARWTTNVSGWIAQAMPASPSFFYDPQQTDIPSNTEAALVFWNAFPGRLKQYYSANPPVSPVNPNPLTEEQIYSLADTGYLDGTASQSFPDIPKTICPNADWSGELKTFGPYGPRGWLDEYCEWSAARDADGNLVRVDFCCENPEYWTTLWKVSPETVAELYEATLNAGVPADRKISVALEDLQLAAIDPETGRHAYNPLNKWNSGPVAVRHGPAAAFTGGAMHLTSTPNTLQTELGLAGTSTPQYICGNTYSQQLICCGNFGQEYRNSDPHIGQTVNQYVGGQATFEGSPLLVCLADPVGLYIQPLINPGNFAFGARIDTSRLPAGAMASDVFQVLRGSAQVKDRVTNQDFPGGMILHVACQIPLAWLESHPDMTLADIEIGTLPIRWAGQIAEQFNIGLYARALPATQKPPTVGCASTTALPAQPQQCLIYSNLWDAYYAVEEVAPTGRRMSLASNTTFIAPQVEADGAVKRMTLPCATPSGTPPAQPAVAVLLADGSGADPAITVVVENMGPVTYAVPGNSFPGDYTALSLSVTVAAGAAPGLRAVSVRDVSGATNSLAAALNIVSTNPTAA